MKLRKDKIFAGLRQIISLLIVVAMIAAPMAHAEKPIQNMQDKSDRSCCCCPTEESSCAVEMDSNHECPCMIEEDQQGEEIPLDYQSNNNRLEIKSDLQQIKIADISNIEDKSFVELTIRIKPDSGEIPLFLENSVFRI